MKEDTTVMNVEHDLRVSDIGREYFTLLQVICFALTVHLNTIPSVACDLDTVSFQIRHSRLEAGHDMHTRDDPIRGELEVTGHAGPAKSSRLAIWIELDRRYGSQRSSFGQC